MPRVIFRLANNLTTEIEADLATTLMQAAVDNGVDGIDAECGGAMACGTCHVYVESLWREKLPAPSKEELDILNGFVSDVRPESRLSCQIKLTDDVDGISVAIPGRQGL